MLKEVVRNKLLPAFLLVALLPVLLLGGYGVFSIAGVLREHNLSYQEERVTLTVERINTFLHGISSDLFYLRDSSAMNLYLSALKSGDTSSQALMLKNLQASLLDFSDKKQIYHQIRFIDKSGMEMVKVERPLDNSKIIDSGKLINEKGQYYFDNAVNLPKDSLFVSSLDLNKENGKVELPIRATVRYATPVFTDNNELKGLLVLNVAAANLIKLISNQDAANDTLVFIDKAGYYYYHPNENKLWGGKADLNSGENIYKDHPSLVDKVESNINLTSFEAGDSFTTLQPVMVGTGHQKLGTLVSMVDSGSVYSKAKYFALVMVGLLLLATLMAVLFSNGLANAFSRSFDK